jgi:hypothetical protein
MWPFDPANSRWTTIIICTGYLWCHIAHEGGGGHSHRRCMCPELWPWSRCSQKVKALLQAVFWPYSRVQLARCTRGVTENLRMQLVDGHLVVNARPNRELPPADELVKESELRESPYIYLIYSLWSLLRYMYVQILGPNNLSCELNIFKQIILHFHHRFHHTLQASSS